MTEINYYELLQVSLKADPEIIQAAYRRLTMRFHPDKNPGDPEAERMQVLLNAAYEVLSDPERRRRYDEENASSSGAGSETTPDVFGELYDVALATAMRGEFELAIIQFTDLIERGCTFPFVFACRAVVHVQIGNLDAAIADYSMACKLDPTEERFKTGLKQVRASQRAIKIADRQKRRDRFLERASRQIQKMATFKITPPALRERVLNPSDPACPFHGFMRNKEALETALMFGRLAFDAHVDMGLAAGKWHEPVWACSRKCSARIFLAGTPDDTAAFARRFAAIVSMNWDDYRGPPCVSSFSMSTGFSMSNEPARMPDPTYSDWKLPWLELDGNRLKKSDDIMNELEHACKAKGLPLLPIGRTGGVRHYQVPPMVVLIREVHRVPRPVMKGLDAMVDDENGILGIGVNVKIDFRPATIIAASSRPDELDEDFMANFPFHFDV